MIGNKSYTEAADFPGIRPGDLVGERHGRREAGPEGTVERPRVRMQT